MPDTTTDLRRAARHLFDAAVKAADPAAALLAQLDRQPLPQPDPGGRSLLIAIGKAAPAMLSSALTRVTGPHAALCITHAENTAPCPGATLFHAAHPVPDAVGLAAGEAVIEMLRSATEKDRVIALISGGGSALVPAPVPGLGLDDKIALNAALLASGLDIVAMNTVRQQVSQLKGGGLTRLAAPAPVTGFLLSDVIGDDLRAIASGPTVAPIGTPEDACAILKSAGLWSGLPDALRQYLSTATPPSHSGTAENHLIGSNGHSLRAAAEAARADFATRIVDDRLTGDVAVAARAIHDAARTLSPDAPPTALLWGGETTVKLTGTGRGGRNQELAVHLAHLAHNTPLPRRWLFLSGGTDGRDGPTDAAGGFADAGTWERIGPTAAALLADNDSNRALALARDLLITGATGTNVADIQILLSVPAPS